jgi:hypothetical protein
MVSLNKTFIMLAIILFATACSREDPCRRLQRELDTTGFEPTDRADCSKQLSALSQVAKPFGSIPNWKKQVEQPSQQFLIDVMVAFVERAKDLNSSLVTFEGFPKALPPATGVSIAEETWHVGPLGQLGLKRPERIYYGFRVQEVAEKSRPGMPYVRFEMLHDFNQDGVVGTSTIEGVVRRGKGFFQGGFVRSNSSSVGLIAE